MRSHEPESGTPLHSVANQLQVPSSQFEVPSPQFPVPSLVAWSSLGLAHGRFRPLRLWDEPMVRGTYALVLPLWASLVVLLTGCRSVPERADQPGRELRGPYGMVPKDELRGVVAWMPGSRLPERLVPMGWFGLTWVLVRLGLVQLSLARFGCTWLGLALGPGFLNAWCPEAWVPAS